MATALEMLQARRITILERIDAATSADLDQPNYAGDGESIDRVGYLESLLKQLGQIDQLIAVAQGPVHLTSRGSI